MAESNLQFSSQNSVNETLARLHVNTAAVVEIRFLRGFRNSTESSRKASKIPTDLRREPCRKWRKACRTGVKLGKTNDISSQLQHV